MKSAWPCLHTSTSHSSALLEGKQKHQAKPTIKARVKHCSTWPSGERLISVPANAGKMSFAVCFLALLSSSPHCCGSFLHGAPPACIWAPVSLSTGTGITSFAQSRCYMVRTKHRWFELRLSNRGLRMRCWDSHAKN